MLWLALLLPDFPLQVVTGHDDGQPVAVYEPERQQPRIRVANRAARRAGIRPGMTLPAAQSLSGELLAIERDSNREAAALRQLAQWALQFTPLVSLQPPAGLLLEIGASLGCFHGLEALRQRIAAGLEPLGYHARQGVAPTPLGAWLLARAGWTEAVTDLDRLRELASELPVELLPLQARQQQDLQAMGIRSIGDCLRLPRADLGRRLGNELLLQLDRLLGDQPDPRQGVEPPERFASQILLPNPVADSQPLLFILQRLLHQLKAFLDRRDAAARRLRLGLISPQRPVEWLDLELLTPGDDPAHLLKLWQEKLERRPLQAPVEGLELQAPELAPRAPENGDLLSPRRHSERDFAQLLEQLRNRLGPNTLQRLDCLDDHRPQYACASRPWRPARSEGENRAWPRRPLWLLPEPQRLPSRDDQPWLRGPLALLDGPERIESGWWDGQDQRRDYYIARSRQQQTLWIYRQRCASGHWFLHGVFG
ncbi:MAG TPA: DNA polymerase Y family protein [Gammaproteobacteria bacterium]|nr:DNA polymerase Y family protein [Gammaproteobacteria bacterium]